MANNSTTTKNIK